MRHSFIRAACVIAVTTGVASHSSIAQTPVGFLPGLTETSGVWAASGPALAASFNISPFYPSLDTSNQPIENQASSLGSLAGSTFLIGHSAGGNVARYYAQHAAQPIAGIITLGTPNFGAPIVQTYPVF